MEIRVKTTNYRMTGDVSDYLDARLKTLEKLLGDVGDVTRCEVEIGRDAGKKQNSDYMWYVEVHVIVPGKKSVYARNTAQSATAAIDDVKEEAERQLRKAKKVGRHIVKKEGAAAKRRLKFGK